MKIALLTIHWVNNYGASLQTFATIKALQKFGEVTLIDYRTNYVAKGMKLLRCGNKARDILRVGKDLFRIIPRSRVIQKFKEFIYSMPISRRVVSDADFADLLQRFDLFVSGSDQIWNPKIICENSKLDKHYMLDFAVNKPKISYASSMGSYRYTSDELTEAKSLLSLFKNISVRERDTADYLSGVLERKIQTVVDPTLLYNKKQWSTFFNISEENFMDEPFILVYVLNSDKNVKDTVQYFRKSLGIKVVAIDQNPFAGYHCDSHIKDASPAEFVKYFHQASFVITNSFHGTCFSLIFNKNFVVTKPPSSGNRITDLLQHLQLMDRYIKPGAKKYDGLREIDFHAVNNLLDKMRSRSFNYIENSLFK